MPVNAIALLAIALWLILASQEPVSDTLTLIIGIVVAVCGILMLPIVTAYRDRA